MSALDVCVYALDVRAVSDSVKLYRVQLPTFSPLLIHPSLPDKRHSGGHRWGRVSNTSLSFGLCPDSARG